MDNTSTEELEKAFAIIEQTHLRVDTVICSECGCTLHLKEKGNEPCEHLITMFKGWEEKSSELWEHLVTKFKEWIKDHV